MSPEKGAFQKETSVPTIFFQILNASTQKRKSHTSTSTKYLVHWSLDPNFPSFQPNTEATDASNCINKNMQTGCDLKKCYDVNYLDWYPIPLEFVSNFLNPGHLGATRHQSRQVHRTFKQKKHQLFTGGAS